MTVKDALRWFPSTKIRAEDYIRDPEGAGSIPHATDVLLTLAKAYYELVREPGIVVVDDTGGGES